MPDPLADLARRMSQLEARVAAQERRAKASGWQRPLMFNTHRYGGGLLSWEFDPGLGRQVSGASAGARWTITNMDASNFAACTYGGPYATFNGSDEYVNVADGPEYEVGSEEFFVAAWVNPSAVSATMTIASKFDTTGGNWRSWRLWYQLGATAFTFSVSATGLAGSAIDATSTATAPVVSNWYFVAGYFQPSTTLNVYVGLNSDAALTETKVTASVPASAHDNAAKLCVGSAGDPGTYWAGKIGQASGRLNVPATYIDEYANMLFLMTKEEYED